MELEDLKSLIEGQPETIRRRAMILYNGMAGSARAYQADPTSAHLKDWQAAEAALRAFAEDVEYGDKDNAKTLPNLLAVVAYLTGRGWKIRKSAAYKHRHEGKLRPQMNGTYRIADVEKYAQTFLKRLDGGARDHREDFQSEKQAAETEKIKAQARHWGMKASILEGRYVEKGLFERELARRAAVFKNDIENFCRSQAAGIINLVAGDVAKAPDLIDFMIGEAENWLGRYAEEREFIVQPPAMAMDDGTEDDFDDGEDGYYGIDAEAENQG